jgi:hypothetical protein
MNLVQRYFRFILISDGIGFAVIMAIFDLFRKEDFSFLRFLINLIFFGFFMALFKVYQAKKQIRRHGIDDFTTENLEDHMMGAVQTAMTQNEIIETLRTQDWHKRVNITEANNVINIASKSNWHYWGDPCTIELSETPEMLKDCIVAVETGRQTDLSNYAANLSNIANLTQLLASDSK